MPAVRRAVVAVVVGGLIGAAAAPATAADQAKVNAAIAAGGEYLRRTVGGGPGPGGGAVAGANGIGRTALAGIAMLEAGVKPGDPVLQAVTQAVRAAALSQTQTYHVVLAILFLDRLGEPADGPTVQFLGVRLYAGMSAHGGWTYECGGGLDAAEEARLRAVLQGGVPAAPRPAPPNKPGQPKKDDGFPKVPDGKKKPADPPSGRLHPEVARYFDAVRQSLAGGRRGDAGDNSNTQFGLIGLWVAARHGVPAADAFAQVEARFLLSQNRTDAGWGYQGGGGPGASGSALAMTCAGLLGLAVGAGRDSHAAPGPKAPKDAKGTDPFYTTKKDPKGAPDPHGAPGTIIPGVGAAERKQAIDAALAAVGRAVRSTPGANGLHGLVGLGDEYYTLWSVERVGVAYGLEKIADADWYEWGCGFLLPAQKPDGSWAGKDGADVGTAFAVLFLSRSNFVGDLTRKLQNKPPAATELRAGEPPPAMPSAPRQLEGARGADGSAPVDPPVLLPPGTDAVADGLVTATAAAWGEKLSAARDTKGAEHTTGLVKAIPKLGGDRQKQARDALADRLTRMTAATLRTMLRDHDAELRRAACLACAMKEDQAHVPDLIERVADPADLVARAARAGLRSLTGQDFGPPPGADAPAKAKAEADWKRWYAAGGK